MTSTRSWMGCPVKAFREMLSLSQPFWAPGLAALRPLYPRPLVPRLLCSGVSVCQVSPPSVEMDT
ncbi:MAG TPA: hypothetical protein PLK31_14915 [Chloroflexota bacterium]|nr:hypothetical protein [Chloroflexota bacterium]